MRRVGQQTFLLDDNFENILNVVFKVMIRLLILSFLGAYKFLMRLVYGLNIGVVSLTQLDAFIRLFLNFFSLDNILGVFSNRARLRNRVINFIFTEFQIVYILITERVYWSSPGSKIRLLQIKLSSDSMLDHLIDIIRALSYIIVHVQVHTSLDQAKVNREGSPWLTDLS